MKYQADFTAIIHRFGEMGEKTGWTYFIIPAEEAAKMHSADKKGFRVKGLLNDYTLTQVALMPMGGGDLIMPLNAAMRKGLKQPLGATIRVRISKDDSVLNIDPELQACLEDEPEAARFFSSLAQSHQKYFSKWITEAKTDATRTRRLAAVIEGLSRKMDYGTMLRWERERRREQDF